MIYKKIYITFAVLITGCSSMYIPPASNIPLISEKNEFQIDGSISTNSIYSSINYAITKKSAVMINSSLSFKNFSPIYDLGVILEPETECIVCVFGQGNFKHKYIDIGFGQYHYNKNYWTKELYYGLGYGQAYESSKFNSTILSGSDTRIGTYYLTYIQGNIGKKNEYIAHGWSLRFSLASYYYKYSGHMYPPNGGGIYYGNNSKTFPIVSIEPTGFCRFGFKRLKFSFKYGLLFAYGFHVFKEVDPFWKNQLTSLESPITHFHLSVGLNVNLYKKKRDKTVLLDIKN